MRKATIALMLGMALAAMQLTGCSWLALKKQLKIEGEVDLDLACRERFVFVLHQPKAAISVHAPYIEVCTTEKITIMFVPPVADDAAHSAPQAEADTWLDGDSEDGKIELTVPMGATGEHKYTITVDGVGSIDPTIRIIP